MYSTLPSECCQAINAENLGFFENFLGYAFLRRNLPISDNGGDLRVSGVIVRFWILFFSRQLN
jgi:hypothetical protein